MARRFSIRLCAAGLGLVVASCQPAPIPPAPITVAEAKKIETNIGADAVQPTFAPPPRTVTDILALLSDIKPDPTFGAKLREQANAKPAAELNGPRLAAFLFDRGVARSDLGDIEKSVQDEREAVRLLKDDGPDTARRLARYLIRLAVEESNLGNNRASVAAAEQAALIRPRDYGAAMAIASARLSLGDMAGAEQAAIHAIDLATGFAADGNNGNAATRAEATGQIAYTRGRLDLTHGHYAEAEGQFRTARAQMIIVLTNFAQLPAGYPTAGFYERRIDHMDDLIVTALGHQLRYAEAEASGREALVQSMSRLGAASANTAHHVSYLAAVVSSAGRHREAAQLAKAVLDIDAALGLDPSDGTVAGARSSLGTYQSRSGQFDEATATFAALKIDLLKHGDAGEYDRTLGANPAFASMEARAGHFDNAIKIEQRCIEKLTPRLGADDIHTSICRGGLGVHLAAAGRRQEALQAFRVAVPILIAASDDDPASNITRAIQRIIASYLRLLDEIRGTPLEIKGDDIAAEGFRLADWGRSQATREVLAQATARMSLSDPALAELARREQDIGNERKELVQILLDVASAPTDQQDPDAVANLRRDIARLAEVRAGLRQEIAQRFPRYADLLSARGATVEQVRGLLRDDEALIAIASLEDRTLIWAVAKGAPLAYASVPMKRSDLAFDVALLRHALDPHATSLAGIPPFDVATAQKLYAALLAPVASAWRGHKSLIIVTDGPLAQVPFGLLVTRSVTQPTEREGQVLFAGYRDVPFLIREAAVTQLSSVSAMVSLRALPQGPPARRSFVGFGDPWFNAQEADEGHREQAAPLLQVASRGGALALRAGPGTEALNNAALSRLPRLPDTADEVRDVATALRADPVQDIYLGARASEEAVRTMKLDDRRVVMFATHGLVAGDLDGLTQPALALSPPAISGGRGDGLLTTEKILGLKLDADWVVLSACNTAAGDGAGAEAVSGLGRAFFYAGARALLVSNWPIETRSARLLTTGAFLHQAADAGLTRAAALRQSELDLIDGPGFVNAEGRAAYSYAHPIFWAPFSLVGDGG